MARIENFRVKNFKVLKDVTLGPLWNQQDAQLLTPMTAVIGKNGVGKSALFDAFGFLADALKLGVEEACDARGRGGFEKLRAQGQAGPIEFQVFYREHENARFIGYKIAIEKDEIGRPYVSEEIMVEDSDKSFLGLREGFGLVWKENKTAEGFSPFEFAENIKKGKRPEEFKDAEIVELEDKRKLGIATLGALKQHPRISAFRRFIEGWYLSYFTPDAARSLPLAGPQDRLSIHGDNLGNVVQFMEREHPERFRDILKNIAGKIPGIDKIDTERTSDGRLSDGTLKVFAYLLLLEDPSPPPFLCIEEPENGLYHKLLETLANEFREHADAPGGSQVFITTPQPYLVNALEPDEVWILEKGDDGFSTIRRASEDPIVNNMVAEGLPLGNLWYSDYFDER